MDITVKQAVDRLVEELNKDKSEGSYYHSWQANIAMAFYDELEKPLKDLYNEYRDLKPAIHKHSNEAAKRFLDILTYQSKEKV